MNKRRDLKISNLRGQVREHEKLRDNSAAPCEHEDLTHSACPLNRPSLPQSKNTVFLRSLAGWPRVHSCKISSSHISSQKSIVISVRR